MRKHLLKQLATLERQHAEKLEAMEERIAFSSALFIVLAYYLGDLRPTEEPHRAFMRALNYNDINEWANDLAQGISGDRSGINKRSQDAYRRLLQKFCPHLKRDSQALKKAVDGLGEQLPAKWKKWLKNQVQDELKSEIRAEKLLRELTERFDLAETP